ncbi:RNA-binding S4 domain-containing protein [Candidatus Woesearchaeota archaeon]|nr:RNA-binding S4 domain-containing protein [Candidatus Woesearchaeota archaeon]
MEEKYIELNTFLKIKGLANSGGEAKNRIRNEEVKVNGEIETRNKRKLHIGDKIEIAGKRFFLKEEEIK